MKTSAKVRAHIQAYLRKSAASDSQEQIDVLKKILLEKVKHPELSIHSCILCQGSYFDQLLLSSIEKVCQQNHISYARRNGNLEIYLFEHNTFHPTRDFIVVKLDSSIKRLYPYTKNYMQAVPLKFDVTQSTDFADFLEAIGQ